MKTHRFNSLRIKAVVGSLSVLAVAVTVLLAALWPIRSSDATASESRAEIKRVASAPAQDKVSFNRDIRPILTENCYACHGPDAHDAKADVQLHSEKVAHDGFLIVPGELEASEVWLRINNKKKPMPPKDSRKVLSREQKDLIKRWIEQGAEYQPHWAYVAPQMSDAPPVKDQAWPDHWIDHYILSKLEDKGLEPVADADRVTLIRRLSFDLTGLPPTPQEVKAFVEAPSPNAYEKLIDRLLASPHFGERMAIYWLDVVRFADTVGYHGDQTMSITPYRDWVIWAFNENLPYDQFVKQQVAGDLIDDPTGNALIASAYNRLYQTSHEGGIQRKECRPCAQLQRCVHGGDDGLRAVPRPQVRPVYRRRLLLTCRVLWAGR